MLTVRVIGADGNEMVKEVTSVFMRPSEQSKLIHQSVYFFRPNGDLAETIEDGDVYVMNDAGKTIADYHIRPPK